MMPGVVAEQDIHLESARLLAIQLVPYSSDQAFPTGDIIRIPQPAIELDALTRIPHERFYRSSLLVHPF